MGATMQTPTLRADFCAMILTHGRPDHVITYDTLRRCGYTGPIVVVIDNEDATADAYHERFGSEVVQFDKAAVAATIDEADNFSDRRAILYARNASFDIAQSLGYRYFVQLDDDYTTIFYTFDSERRFLTAASHPIRNLDSLFEIMLRYFESIPALSIAMTQGGDMLGGRRSRSSYLSRVMTLRKAMNSFICSTDRRFRFFGRLNEDVNAYTTLGTRGALFLTVNLTTLNQLTTQANAGGMTDIYRDSGTYVKSFYTVMHCPSSVRVVPMRSAHKRLHHQINWARTVPKIIDETHRKRAVEQSPDEL